MVAIKVLLIICFVFSCTGSDDLSRVVPGGILHPDTSVLLFESTIPLRFLVTLPSVASQFSELNSTCIEPKNLCELYNNTLLTAKLVQQEVLDANYYIKKSTPSRSNSSRPQRNIFGIASEGQINDLHADLRIVDRRLDMVSNSFLNDHFTLVNVTRDINAFDNQFRGYLASSAKNISAAFRELRAEEVKSEHMLGSTIQNVAVMLYNIEVATSMNVAASECRSKLLSRTLVSQKVLSARLATLDLDLAVYGWKQAVDMQKLLTLPFADCQFTPSTVLVTITVPIVRHVSDLQLHWITKVPFKYNDRICTLKETQPYVVMDGRRVLPVPPPSKTCNLPSGFCLLKSPGTISSKFQKCAQLLKHGGALSALFKACVMECEEDDGEPRVVDLGDGSVSITNSKHLILMCNKTATVVEANTTIGTVAVSIPCHCELLVDKTMAIPAQFPCGTNLTRSLLKEVRLPPQWITLNVTKLTEIPDTLDKYLDKLDENWEKKIPHIRVDNPLPLAGATNIDTRVRNAEDTGFWSTVWLISLTIAVAILFSMACMDSVRRTFASSSSNGYMLAAAPFLPGVKGQDASNSFGSYLWKTVREIEIGGVIMSLVWIFLAIVCIIIVVRVLRGVRHISRVVDYLSKDEFGDEEMQPVPTNKRSRK